MFVWSDAWLLLSLIYSGEPADRERLRSIGDFINHAIFTDEELDEGLVRLQHAGYVSAHGDKYSASAEVLAWYASITARKSRIALHKDLERVTSVASAVRIRKTLITILTRCTVSFCSVLRVVIA